MTNKIVIRAAYEVEDEHVGPVMAQLARLGSMAGAKSVSVVGNIGTRSDTYRTPVNGRGECCFCGTSLDIGEDCGCDGDKINQLEQAVRAAGSAIKDALDWLGEPKDDPSPWHRKHAELVGNLRRALLLVDQV